MPKISLVVAYIVLLTICISSLLIGAVTVDAAIYYVAATGDDARACTTAQTSTTPKRTIASGVACLNPGDTLYLRSGTYTEQIDLMGPNKSGTAGNYITIAGYPGETVTIQYADLIENGLGPIKARGNRGYFIFENLVLDGIASTRFTGWQIRDGNHHFILRNLEIKNQKYNGVYIEGNDIQILNCKIHDAVPATEPGGGGSYYYGVYFHHGINGLIQGNDIFNNSGGGIHAYPGPISNLVIRNNKIHDNNYIAGSKIGGIIVFEGSNTPISGVQVYNNLVYNNGSAPTAGDAQGIRISNGPDATKVWNNTVYANKGWGINIQAGTSPPTNTVVQNNIVFANTDGQIVNAGTGSILGSNLTNNPNFVNGAAFDFNLQSSSLAIDAGVYLSDIKTDFMNRPRPQGTTHDIGAFEAGTASASAPAPPKGLKVF